MRSCSLRRRQVGLGIVAFAAACGLAGAAASAFTVYSNHASFMKAGTFFGPGKLPDSPMFDITIRNVIFLSDGTFVTPFRNGGKEGPHTEGEIATETAPNGMFSDGVTMINENADAGPFALKWTVFLAVIADGGPPEQLAGNAWWHDDHDHGSGSRYGYR